MRGSLSIAVLVLLAGAADAVQRPSDVVHWSVSPGSVTFAPQGVVKVTVRAEIENGWHIYAMTQPPEGPPPLAIAIIAAQPFEVRTHEIDAPPPAIAQDPNFNTETRYYEGRVAIVVPVAARKSATAGAHRLPIDVTFQACSTRICLRPFTQTLVVDATVRSSSKGPRR